MCSLLLLAPVFLRNIRSVGCNCSLAATQALLLRFWYPAKKPPSWAGGPGPWQDRVDSQDQACSASSLTSRKFAQESFFCFRHANILRDLEDVDGWEPQGADVRLQGSAHAVQGSVAVTAAPHLQIIPAL